MDLGLLVSIYLALLEMVKYQGKQQLAECRFWTYFMLKGFQNQINSLLLFLEGLITYNFFHCRKFEEIYPPEVAEFVYITDDTYTKKQVLRMEHLVLKVLAFDLAAPTVNQFLTQYFLHQHSANCKVESLAMVSSLHLLNEESQVTQLNYIALVKGFSVLGTNQCCSIKRAYHWQKIT